MSDGDGCSRSIELPIFGLVAGWLVVAEGCADSWSAGGRWGVGPCRGSDFDAVEEDFDGAVEVAAGGGATHGLLARANSWFQAFDRACNLHG